MAKTNLVTCGVQNVNRPRAWTLERRPRCNRVAGHPDEHREYDGNTFEIKSEWTDAEVWIPRGAKEEA